MARTRFNFKQLARIFSNRQDDTTNNASPADLRIEYGWGRIPGNGASIIAETVTFAQPFNSVPIIIVNGAGGVLNTTGGYPDAGDYYDDNLMAGSTLQTVNGFNAKLARAGGATFSNTTSVFYTWIAIGS